MDRGWHGRKVEKMGGEKGMGTGIDLKMKKGSLFSILKIFIYC